MLLRGLPAELLRASACDAYEAGGWLKLGFLHLGLPMPPTSEARLHLASLDFRAAPCHASDTSCRDIHPKPCARSYPSAWDKPPEDTLGHPPWTLPNSGSTESNSPEYGAPALLTLGYNLANQSVNVHRPWFKPAQKAPATPPPGHQRRIAGAGAASARAASSGQNGREAGALAKFQASASWG